MEQKTTVDVITEALTALKNSTPTHEAEMAALRDLHAATARRMETLQRLIAQAVTSFVESKRTEFEAHVDNLETQQETEAEAQRKLQQATGG